MAGLFERIHEELGGGSWLIGRVTGSEYAKAQAYPSHTDQTYPREPWFARRDAKAYGIALDAGQDRLGAVRYWRRPGRRGADRAGLRRASGGAAPGRRLLHFRRRAGARSRVGAGDFEPRAGDRTPAARRWRRLERGLSTGRPDRRDQPCDLPRRPPRE